MKKKNQEQQKGKLKLNKERIMALNTIRTLAINGGDRTFNTIKQGGTSLAKNMCTGR